MIEIAKYTSRMDAEMAKSLLASCGIKANIVGDDKGATAPHLAYILGVRLYVTERDKAHAIEILNSQPVDEVNQDTESQELKPPGDPLVIENERRLTYALRAVLFGSLMLPFVANLYSLFLVMQVLPYWGVLAGRSRYKFVAIGVLNIAVFYILFSVYKII